MLTGEWREGLLTGVVKGGNADRGVEERTAERGSGGKDC